MANIIVQGKQYNNVPAVNFPKVGGGVATYTEGGGGVTVEQLNISAAGTYTAPTGTAYSPVVVPSGTEGTPTATKGTVSSHSITVTPSVTNTGGYISGSTKTGTAVTVSASELVSGTKSITSAGTTDVTNYASASVASGSVVVDDVELNENDLTMSASVDSGGLVTYSVAYQGYTDATVSSGFVSSAVSGGLEVTATNSYQLPTQSARTITPSTSSQTAVASGMYTTGAITVDPIPSQYIIPTGTVSITNNGTVDVSQYASASVSVPATTTSYLGTNPVKIADYATQTVALSNTNFATWTPSTKATDIYASSNAGTAVLDTSNYDYEIIWFFDISFVYDGTESGERIRRQCLSIRQSIYKSPSNLTYLSNKDYNYNRCTTLFTSGLVDYYNSSNALALSYTLSVGIFPSATACTYSSNTSNTPTVTIKTPKISAVCHNTFLTTTNCAKIDKANTKFTLRGELWRVDKDSAMQGMYRNIVELYNS